MKKWFGVVCGVWMVFLVVSPTFAEEKDAAVLETMIVTAQKKEENVQDVPGSVSVLGDLQIEDAGIDSLDDVHLYVPNFATYSMGAVGGYYSIRGQSNLINASEAVGIYIDDVPASISSWAKFSDIYETERIEVLRGPQGNLYGLNAAGGVVNIITRKPGNISRANAVMEYGNYESQAYQAMVSGPVVKDNLFVGLAGKYNRRDSYIEEAGTDTHEEGRLSSRAQLRWTPGDRTEILLTAASENYASDYGEWVRMDDDPFKIENMGLDEDVDVSGDIYSMTIRYHAPWFDLTAVTAAVSGDYDSIVGKDYTSGGDNLKYMVAGQESRKGLQEIRLASNAEKQNLQWLLGGFYLDAEEDSDNSVFNDTGGAGAPTGVYAENKSQSTIGTQTFSLFGQAGYTFFDRLTATAGLRYDRDECETDFEHDNNGTLISDYEASASWDAYSPKFMIDYRINDSAMTYASAAKGYKAGGFSSHTGDTPEAAMFEPEYSWSYEAGVKTDWLGNRIIANLCGFYTMVADIQIMYTDPASWQMSYKNAAEARLWGIELETLLRPLTGLQITGSFGLLESEFTEHETQAYVGNHVPLAPAYQAGLSAQYLSPWGLFLRAEGIWTGKSYFGEDNLYSQDDYVIVNAKAGFQIDTYGIFFYMKNAFDKTYYTFANSRGGVDKGILGAPRTFGIQAALRF